ncbi:2-keto-3-deoxygluconate kinase [Jannaschia faecimaris]|uniref:2-keto-3-deoxygluconate kinase n=1 Tax=Jannaschia faecimaris TaxID=1244108 RepID=A0A1H3ST24_9RHOB|nr:sugar kinase [Jannaschia faecimaris]SDZ40701.1 2-keto-3-deoxygluconate kinase [Jannaschia faecimaris]
MSRIVCIGECMIEMAPTTRDAEYRMGFAGDTMNTAWYLRRLLPHSDEVDYFTAVGSDAASGQMVDFLAREGLGTAHVLRRADRTIGLYMIQLQDGERSFSYWRGQSAARTLAQDAGPLSDALDRAQVAYFSGITLAILPQADRARLLDTLGQFRANGGEVVFDPNLRPRLWQTTEEMTASVMQAAGISDTVLPSHEDEAAWFGDADPAATADRYSKAGARTVVVKNGPGQILACQDGTITEHAPVAVAEVVDTTAAGDSFNAGYLAHRIDGQTIPRSIQAAAELAALVVRSRGALVSTGGA